MHRARAVTTLATDRVLVKADFVKPVVDHLKVTGVAAQAMGLLDELVPADSLQERADQFARTLAKGGQQAMAVTKHWLNELEGSLVDEPFQRAAQISADVIAGDEAQDRLKKIFGPS